MSKITEYTSASTFDANDVLLKDGENGTMIISVEDAASEFKRLSGVDDDISGVTQTVTQTMNTIASNIAGVETDYIASKDYAIGDLFVVNNVLYKATAAIAEEDIIDTETNCAIVNLGDEIGDIRAELLNKANADGSYDEFTAGSSKQLLGTVFIEDDEPYLFRTSGGSIDIGDREYDEIVGGSIVWNQMVRNGNFGDGTNYYSASRVTLSASNGVLTVAKDQNTQSGVGYTKPTGFVYVLGHKYLARVDYKGITGKQLVVFSNLNGAGMTKITPIDENWHTISKVFSVTELPSVHGILWLMYDTTTDDNVAQFRNYAIFDLTQMFGSEIADYIYNLEQTTPGAGVAWFRKYFPKDYYEYNAGELKHVEGLTSHNMVGFNLFDENILSGINGITKTADGWSAQATTFSSNNFLWNSVPHIDGMAYCITANIVSTGASNAFVKIIYTDNTDALGDKIYAGSSGVSTITSDPAKTISEVRISYGTNGDKITVVKDICVNLSWDGERDGEYEPYVKHSYPLDSSLTLRGIPKLSTDGKLYFDGDRYASDGTVTRKYGIVDLGTLEWIAEGDDSFRVLFRSSKLTGLCLCMKYKCVQKTQPQAMVDGELSITNSQNTPLLRIKDSSYADADAATFKAAMSGIYLVYELAEPTTEEAQPFQSPQIVDDFGTEEYVTSSIVPVGHTTQYDHNLRAKLEMAPNSPDGDGDYLVRQTGSKNEYVPYTDGGRITALEGKIPAVPSANGSYILKCTVTDGTATYAWVTE